MAEGAVQLPPDGAGTRLRTVTNAGVAAGAHQEVVTLARANGTLVEPATETTLATKLEAIRALLDGTLDVSVSNPTTSPETGLAKEVTLEAIRALVDGTLAVAGTVALDASTLAALETINAVVAGTVAVSNPTADPETGLAKDATLQSVRDRGDFPLPATQVDSLKPLATQPVSGTVGVGNFPTAYPAPVQRILMDYVARSDAQPVYLGSASPGSASSAAVWKVTKFQYESANADARLLGSDVREAVAWNDRTTPTPAWPF